MGSDWYMTEGNNDVHGVGIYYQNMFYFLRDVTRKIKDQDASKAFDAWYQFSFLNPMKFLGILKDDNTLDKTKLEKYKEYVDRILDLNDDSSKEWKRDFARVTSDDVPSIKSKSANYITKLTGSNLNIMDSKDIKDSATGELLILSVQGP